MTDLLNQDQDELPKAFWWTAAAATVVLLLGYVHAAAAVFGLPPPGGALFNLNTERNLPAWFSTLLLFAVAVAMLRGAYVEFALKLGTAWGWLVLGVGFIYLSIDEQVRLHERLNGLLDMGPGVFHYSWVVFAIPGAIILALSFTPFLLRLPRSTASRLVVAGAVFLMGSVGFEMIGGLLISNEQETFYLLSACMEESLEVIGTLLALRCLLLHLRALGGRSQLHRT
jgi:hypothetical protein